MEPAKRYIMDFPAQVLTSYLRQGAVSTQLVPLFVTSSPGESSDTESAEEEETEDTEGPLGSGARCVVCQLERVTRAALPCRYPALFFPYTILMVSIFYSIISNQ